MFSDITWQPYIHHDWHNLNVFSTVLQTPVIVDQNNLSSFDLLTTNEVVHESEVMYERGLTTILKLHPILDKA